MRAQRRSFLPFAVLVAAALAASCLENDGAGDGIAAGDRAAARVVEVVDGDTIRVALDGGEVPVRLIGIDTPERDGPFTEEECLGPQASRFTADALDGRDVELEYDVERTDRFDRVLAYVWIEDTLFNERILERGLAVLATFPPNVRYVDRFTAAQELARDQGLGLWAACRS
jgi:micrococcal nuclease